MQVHVFVLHLVRAAARRDNAQALLADAKEIGGLSGEIWPAVDGAALSSAELSATVGTGLFEPPYPFALKTGEIGCFLSHRQIWAEIVRRDLDAGLILEDDIRVDPALFAPALSVAIQNADAMGYVKLREKAPKGEIRLIDRLQGATLVLGEQPGVGATAQVVGRAAAKRLLEQSASIDRPIDTFVQSHWYTGLRPATVYPSGVAHIDEELDGSTIQSKNKRLMQTLRREVARMRYRSAVKRLSRDSTAPYPQGLP